MKDMLKETGDKIICVLGMHRSGTSLLSRVLNLMGVSLGPNEHLMRPRSDNPRGFWENTALSGINDRIFSMYGGSWDNTPHFPESWQENPELDALKAEATGIIKRDFSGAALWGFKDPRTSLTLPFWQTLVPDMRYVIVIRNPLDVALSLLRRDGFSLEKSSSLWVNHLSSAFKHTSGKQRMALFYEDFMEHRAIEIKRLAEFIGRPELAGDVKLREGIDEFADKELQHGASGLSAIINEERLGFPAKALYLALRLGMDKTGIDGMEDDDEKVFLNMAARVAADALGEQRLVESAMEEAGSLKKFNLEIEAQIRKALLGHKEKDRQIKNLERLILVKDQYAKNLEASVKLKEESVKEKEDRINALEAADAEKTALIAGLEASGREKDAHIRSLDNTIRHKDLVIDGFSGSPISSSFSSIKRAFSGLRDRFLPRGTKRRAIIKRLIKKKTIAEEFVCGSLDMPAGKGPFAIGRGNFLYVQGWCYHTIRKIKRLFIDIGDVSHEVRNFGHLRLDVFNAHYNSVEFTGNSLFSGYWAIVRLPEVASPTDAAVVLRAELAGGGEVVRQAGSIAVEPAVDMKPVSIADIKGLSRNEPVIAICMATYNPDFRLFKQQIDSIKSQDYTNWVCVITDDSSEESAFRRIWEITSDDERFKVIKNNNRLGHYFNFEESLKRVPKEASYVAFADQDDFWHPDKLRVMLHCFDDDTYLVYSDMNIVDESRNIIHTSYWTDRKNNFKELDLLIIANTVTGAASMFKRDLLDYVLPFPQLIGDSVHDMFIACTALALGKIQYVDSPLYDYTQHSSNVVGHYTLKKHVMLEKIRGAGNLIRYDGALKGALKRFAKRFLDYQGEHYRLLPRRVLHAKTIGLRCAGMSAGKAVVIKRFSSMEGSVLQLISQYIKDKVFFKDGITIGVDYLLLRNALGSKAVNICFGLGRAIFIKRKEAERRRMGETGYVR